MSKFGNNGLQRLKARAKGPAKDHDNLGVGNTDKQYAKQKAEMAKIIAANQKRMGYKPQLRNQGTISAPTPEDSAWQKFKTVLKNPFDALKVALVPEEGAYSSLTNLRRAKKSSDPQTQKQLSRSKEFNIVSSVTPAAMTAQTVADLASGDPMAAVTKKLNKIPVVKKVIKDPKKALKTAKAAYLSLKGESNVASKL